MKRTALLLLALIPGCDWGMRQADHLGSYMPVIGERCDSGVCLESKPEKKPQAEKPAPQTAPASQPDPRVQVQPPAIPNPSAPRGIEDSGYYGH